MDFVTLANAAPPQSVSQLPLLVIIIATFGIFYFILIRPQQKKQKELKKMVEELKKGDRVMTNGGIFGTVAGIKDNVLVLKIADGVQIELLRSAVASVVSKKSE